MIRSITGYLNSVEDKLLVADTLANVSEGKLTDSNIKELTDRFIAAADSKLAKEDVELDTMTALIRAYIEGQHKEPSDEVIETLLAQNISNPVYDSETYIRFRRVFQQCGRDLSAGDNLAQVVALSNTATVGTILRYISKRAILDRFLCMPEFANQLSTVRAISSELKTASEELLNTFTVLSCEKFFVDGSTSIW